MGKRPRGFTLVELMIAAAVMVILLAIAVPSYQENVRRSRRAEAQTAMLGLAQALERYYTNHNTYAGARLDGPVPLFPAAVPATGGAANYLMSIVVGADAATPLAAGSTYTITATRQGPNAGDPCGDLTLTAAGTRGLVDASRTVAECWN